jgi:hypothetical protein
MSERYVLLGLARARAEWFRVVGQWTNAAVLPAEFLRCVSVEEVMARLRSGRRFSAVLIAADAVGLDRDVIDEARRVGASVIVIDDGTSGREWQALGAASVLAPVFSRDELLAVLAATSSMIGATRLPAPETPSDPAGARGRLAAVTGPGGTGASSVAMALAQGLGRGEGRRVVRRQGEGVEQGGHVPSVLLADLCLCADQALLHDARVLVPGLQEVVEAHRTSVPTPSALVEQTFDVPARGYRLLLGLRRHRHWASLRPRMVDATLDSLQRRFDVVVADVDVDVEGERETGSLEVEDRNLLARASLARADVAVVVGEPSVKGLVSLVRVLTDLFEFGVTIERMLPVLTNASRSPRVRAERMRTLADLLSSAIGPASSHMLPAVQLPTRDLDGCHRDAAPLPGALSRPLARVATAVFERVEPQRHETIAPARVLPGTLTGFTPSEGSAS